MTAKQTSEINLQAETIVKAFNGVNPQEHLGNNANEPERVEPDAVTQPLPDGWVEVTDLTSNLPFYFNEREGAITWERPAVTSVDNTAENDQPSNNTINGPNRNEEGTKETSTGTKFSKVLNLSYIENTWIILFVGL